MWKRLIPVLLFIAYTALLIKVMVFKDIPTIHVGQLMLNFGGTDGGHPANFIPFTTIGPYLLGSKGWLIAGINLVGNIALLVPIGLLLPFVYSRITWKKSLVIAIVSGLVIETLQTLLHVGIFDIDDVILNAFGVILGYFAMRLLLLLMREKKYIHILVATVFLISGAAVAFYMIYPWGQPVNPGASANNGQITEPYTVTPDETDVPQKGDLCGGTGGTGEIISQGEGSIDIKSKDSVVQTIIITNQTEIKNSSGPIYESDLKVGDHVTIVTFDQKKTATVVLVCGT